MPRLATLALAFLLGGGGVAESQPPTSAVAVKVQWERQTSTVKTHASLQVVTHQYLERASPIHDASFDLLAALKPVHARFVPWKPMPEYSGCELTAPTGLGTADCSSSWNCTLPDTMMEDFWKAVDGDHSEAIPNFSTQPSWMYPNPDLNLLGDYYGRLLAWYTQGGVTDECGREHTGGHHYNITYWEVFNEPIAEHSHTKENYTASFDAIVQGIRRWADPEKKIKFVGINLANIRSKEEVQEWVEFFLNPANHAEDCRDALDFIGYHSYPTASFKKAITADPNTLTHLFDYFDSFVEEVHQTSNLIRKLSPKTQTMLDECGTTRLPQLVNPADPASGPLYWVSSGTGFVYLYLRTAALSAQGVNVPVVGMSQLMDDVKREPGVSMIDWTNGNGTARYWALKLLRDACAPGDSFVSTAVSGDAGLYAQGVIRTQSTASNTAQSRRLVLVNKRYIAVTVKINSVSKSCMAHIVDTDSGEGPARTEACGDSGSVSIGPFGSAVIYV